jgi:phage shock protein A
MAPITDAAAVKALSRQLAKLLRTLMLPLKRRVKNHQHHIEHLLATAKQLRSEIDALREDIAKTKQRIEWGEEA